MAGYGFKPMEDVEYLSKSYGGYMKTKVQIVHSDGTVEVACKPGARLNPQKGDVRHIVPESAPHQVSGYSKGDLVEYHSPSKGRWIECNVTEVRGDGALQISCKPNQWIVGGAVSSSVRSCSAAEGAGGGVTEQMGADQWEFIEKAGMIAGGMEDKVGSIEEAKSKALANPGDYMGYTNSGPMVFLRKQGSSFLATPGWTSQMLSCKPIKYSGKLFEDQFTTNTSAFTGGLENGKGGTPHVCWKRTGRGDGLLDRPGLKLFGGIDPNDLKQGAVGDCSLIAAIACLCEFPECVKKLFKEHTLTQDGHYTVTLWDWHTKSWKSRTIDDRFATKDKDAPGPLFVQATEDLEIYPMLIEKAVAIMAGGFDFMSSIMPPWALGVLTGNPDVWHFTAERGQWTGSRPVYDTSTYESVSNVVEQCWPDHSSGKNPKTNAQLWGCMRDWDRQNFMMICGSAAQGQSDKSSLPCGIIYMHAYSVIEVLIDVAGTGINMAKVRNPHGQGGQEPDLPWKDNDALWNQYPAIAQACGVTEHGHEADGMFWITDKDFFGPSSNHYNTLYLVKQSMKRRSNQRGCPG